MDANRAHVEPGDILLLHTGHARHLAEHDSPPPPRPSMSAPSWTARTRGSTRAGIRHAGRGYGLTEPVRFG
ncbi:hypothetical protein [Streptomyces sp. NPDC056453]|uniref:hypothetical protein n=1 Tax=Streptomyces sp. NPDC056453 TaxID=3345822 RepID=UPI003697FACF